ncbi:MAG TPA: hypothetical protein VN783_00845 [Thermoanaerobaculia bacterium]|nr:hypothetical protein [Thermoanaerobaculia bacterium]
MSFPAVLPLLVSSPAPPARRALAAAREGLALQGGNLRYGLAAEPALADWERAARDLHALLVLPDSDPAVLGNAELLANPAGSRLALALIEFAEESVDRIADLTQVMTVWARRVEARAVEGFLSVATEMWALRGDVYRRTGQSGRAEFAFGKAFNLLARVDDRRTHARVEDLFARYERSRGDLPAAIEGWAPVVMAYRAAGQAAPALDAAVRMIATLCELGRTSDFPARRADFAALSNSSAIGTFLAREIAGLTARGRDAAACLFERLARGGVFGPLAPWETNDLADLRFDSLAARYPLYGPGPTARGIAAGMARELGRLASAEALVGSGEWYGLFTLAHLELAAGPRLPADLHAALTYFIGPNPFSGEPHTPTPSEP